MPFSLTGLRRWFPLVTEPSVPGVKRSPTDTFAVWAGTLMILTIGATCLCFVVYTQLALATPVPLFDHWAFFIKLANDRGVLSVRHLFEIHNGHWIVVPRLFYLSDYLLNGKNNLLFFSIICFQIIQLLVFGAAWASASQSRLSAVVGIAAGASFMFSPLQMANFLWPWQIAVMISATAASVALYYSAAISASCNLARRPKTAFAAIIVSALIGSLSFASGLMIWPALIFQTFAAGKKRYAVTLSICGLFIWLSFLYLLPKQASTSHPASASALVASLVSYFLTYVGGLYGSFGVPVAQIVGAGGIALSLVALSSVTKTSAPRAIDLFASGQILWFLLNAVTTTAARYQLGVPQALESRYETFCMMFWLALAMWVSGRLSILPAPQIKPQMLLMLVVVLFVTIPSWRSWRKMRDAYYAQTDGLRMAAAALLSDVYDPSEIQHSALNPEVAQSAYRLLRNEHKSFFAGRILPESNDLLSRHFRVLPGDQCSGEIRRLEFVQDPGESGIKVSGSVTFRNGRGISTYLIAGDDRIIGYGTQLLTSGPNTKTPLLPQWQSRSWGGYGSLARPFTTLSVYGQVSANTVCRVAEKEIGSGLSAVTYSSSVLASTKEIANGKIGVFRGDLWVEQAVPDNMWNSPVMAGKGTFGQSGDKAICGDWTGSGHLNIGVFRRGNWYLDIDGDGAWNPLRDKLLQFGQAGDIPVLGDWNQTGHLRIGVFRQGEWRLDMDGDGRWNPKVDRLLHFGQAGDVPVVGDWTGNGKLSVGVFRQGRWLMDSNANGKWDPGVDEVAQFGEAGDTPVVGNWDRFGRLRIGVFRKGTWFFDMNGDHRWEGPYIDRVLGFGGPGDQALSACWQ